MRPRFRVVIAAAAAVVVTASHSSATTRNVPSPSFPTIKSALDLSTSPGDTVLVAPGVYSGEGNYNLVLGLGVTLLSEAGPEQTVIDCQSLGQGVLSGSGDVIVQGFTIRNGTAVNGGGYGGAIHFSGLAFTIRNCILMDNTAQFGGAIYMNAVSFGLIENCEIINNTATVNGGGVALIVVSMKKPQQRSTIEANAHLVGCRIAGNSAGGSGGGIYAEDFSPVLESLVVTGNTAQSGGGIGLVQSTALLSVCTIAGNSAVADGGGLYINGPALSIQSSIVWDNCAAQGPAAYVIAGTGPVNFSCSDVDLSLVVGPLGTSLNVFTQDPLFCGSQSCDAAPTSDSSYELRESSPLLHTAECGTIGASTTPCSGTPVMNTTWSDLKSRQR